MMFYAMLSSSFHRLLGYMVLCVSFILALKLALGGCCWKILKEFSPFVLGLVTLAPGLIHE